MAVKVIINQKAITDLKKQIGERLELVGVHVESEAIKNINDMEAVDTGRLKNSITHVTDKEELKTSVGTNVEYATFVEMGTEKMAPRPFLREAINNNIKKIEEILNK